MSDKVIIELLLLPRMVVWKRSPPMSKEDAEARVKLYAGAETFTTRIVSAEKYKKEAGKTVGPGDVQTKQGYGSRVE